MSVEDAVKFLRSQGETLFGDDRFAECADVLEAVHSTICRVHAVAGAHWDSLVKVYAESRNADVQEAQNALAEVCNMTGGLCGWGKTIHT